MVMLAPYADINTPAGIVRMPDFVEPWHPPTAEDKRSLFAHMNAIGLPASAWNEWRRELHIGCERVGDIRSYFDLFTIWLRVARWQVSCRVLDVPRCEWGRTILEQARAPAPAVVRIKNPPELKNMALTATAETLFS